ncbi:unnamed protein product [Brassica napus]|uniref:(rape) hypothetical protein n=1 Tax=Brassica napus TaxID=3708 RepID=A0A816IVE6_BRANA|nr:unnamed protein product [Brassica napus]
MTKRKFHVYYFLKIYIRVIFVVVTKTGTGGAASRDRIAVEAREALLRRASQGTLNFHTTKQVNRAVTETVPKEVVLGLYV